MNINMTVLFNDDGLIFGWVSETGQPAVWCGGEDDNGDVVVDDGNIVKLDVPGAGRFTDDDGVLHFTVMHNGGTAWARDGMRDGTIEIIRNVQLVDAAVFFGG